MKSFISFARATERQFYAGIFVVLTCLWSAIAAAILVLLLMTLLPDHRGWSDGLRGLEELEPPNSIFWSS